MRNNVVFYSATAGLLAVILLAGCATKAPQRATRVEPLMFSNDIAADVQSKVNDENDPRQVILFALDLSGRGRHRDAARFFREAAERFSSEDNELAVACSAAAANEYLLAGDALGFRAEVKNLEQAMNRFQAAGADARVAGVLALGDLARGARRPGPTTPEGAVDLFEGPEKQGESKPAGRKQAEDSNEAK
ncbi:MAG: hypothetical protein WC299_04715 [Kiritimatiellia bacterium]